MKKPDRREPRSFELAALNDPNAYVGVPVVCALSGFAPATIRRYERLGVRPKAHRIAGRIRWPLHVVRGWLAQAASASD